MNAPPKFPRSITMTSREFNQHTSRAKAAADRGPVIITDRGKPAYVLTTYATYEASNPGSNTSKSSAAESLADPNCGADDIDLMDLIPPRRAEASRFSFDEGQ